MSRTKKIQFSAKDVNDMQKWMPQGIVCPIDGKTICGTFKSLDDYYKWDGERYCRTSCVIGREGKKKLSGGIDAKRNADEGIKNKKMSSPRKMAKELYDSQQRKPYEARVRGRKVA